MMVSLDTPYLLFLGDARDPIDIKTARGIHHFRRDWCRGEFRISTDAQSLGLPQMTPQQAADAGVRTLVVGTVNAGGFLPDDWVQVLSQAAASGLDVASGMHQRLSDIEALREAAQAAGTRLIDVREPGRRFPVGSGRKRRGTRLLTVGTDCSVGKMYTSLQLEAGLRARGLNARFLATGQTGILIAGAGVPVDAVVADFISGSVETLSPDAPGEWHVIEGQGSLHHPAYAGVTLGLIHGAQPDFLVVCHEPTRRHMRHVPHQQLPSLQRTVEATLQAASLTNPNPRCLGFSLNTSALAEEDARAALQRIEDEFTLPATDPVRFGVEALVEEALRLGSDNS